MDCAWRQGTAPMNPMLLQHTLRGLCSNGSQWVYAVFWRILPRNYPPPQWDTEGGGIMDRSKGNKRNWILVWEDGFCNFSACASTSDNRASCNTLMSVRQQQQQDEKPEELTMNPELFFKMSHEVYNYGEGLMGKVAVDNSHKWVCREPLENDAGLHSSPWQNSIDPHPRTWEGQFKSGIQTIAVVAVQEGVLQLGSTQKIMEDLNFVIYVNRKFNFLNAIPGALPPHLSKRGNNHHPLESTSFPPFTRGSSIINQFLHTRTAAPLTGTKRPPPETDLTTSAASSSLNLNSFAYEPCPSPPKALHTGLYQNPTTSPTTLLPSMSSLQALLSKLPSVTVPLHDNNNNSSYPSDGGRFLCPPISHSSDMHRLVDQDDEEEETALASTEEEKPRYNSTNGSSNNSRHSSMFDSFDNFTELGIQEALENGDSSYTSFLNEICS